MNVSRVLVVGGSGSLGKEVLKYLTSKSVWVSSISFQKCENCEENVVLTQRDNLNSQLSECVSQLEGIRKRLSFESAFLDSIICVAGGWRGGNAADEKFIPNCDDVIKQSVWSSLISAHLASKYLKPEGLLVLSGASAAQGATPYMMGYGMAKAAVHQLTKSLGAEKSGVPKGACVACLLIGTLDTEMNRAGMPKADFSKWTKLDFISDLVFKWTVERDSRPPTGALVEMITCGGQTNLSYS